MKSIAAGRCVRYASGALFRRTYVCEYDITIAHCGTTTSARPTLNLQGTLSHHHHHHIAIRQSCLLRPTVMAGPLGLTLCICLCFWRTHCQTLQAPTDLESYLDLTTFPLPANTGGAFTYPTKVTQVYDEGSPMTIAWDTTYEHISLYVAYVHNISLAAPVDGSGNSQRQLQSESG